MLNSNSLKSVANNDYLPHDDNITPEFKADLKEVEAALRSFKNKYPMLLQITAVLSWKASRHDSIMNALCVGESEGTTLLEISRGGISCADFANGVIMYLSKEVNQLHELVDEQTDKSD